MTSNSSPDSSTRHCGARRSRSGSPGPLSHRRPCVLELGHTGWHQDVLGETWQPSASRAAPAPGAPEAPRLYYGVLSGEQALALTRIEGVYRLPLGTLIILTPEGLNGVLSAGEGPARHCGRRIEVDYRGTVLNLWPLHEH